MKPLISKCSMIPTWHELVPISGHVKESETARKLQLYATSIKTSVSTRLNIGILMYPVKLSWKRSGFLKIFQRFSRAGPRGKGREWATLGVHPLSWLLSNNRLEEVCSTLTKGTFSSQLLLSNQVKGCSPSVAHSLPLPLGPALLNLSIVF